MRCSLSAVAVVAATLAATACEDRRSGTPIVSVAECTALGGHTVVSTGDGGASDGGTSGAGCGVTGTLLGYLDPAEIGTAGGACCE